MRSQDLVCISLSRQRTILNNISVRMFTNADSSPYHHKTWSVMPLSRHTKTRLLSHSGLMNWTTESGLILEQHLSPTYLHPTSMFSSAFSLVCSVSCYQWSTYCWPTCIHTTLIKSDLDCLIRDLLLLNKRNCPRIYVALALLSRRAVNRIYRSLFAVVAE